MKEDVAQIGELLDTLKKDRKKHEINLDIRQVLLHTLFQTAEERPRKMREYVEYLRVSTQRQGQSGLGLDAQKRAVREFAKQNGAKVVGSFTEIESGRKTERERPELAAALAYSKRRGATLVVAKLDRLARNVAFLSRLMDGGVDFVACDNPHANRLTIHILAAVAEDERERISARTKAALAEAKARGVLLGSARPGHWEGREEARRRGGDKGLKKAHEVVKRKAREEYKDLVPTIAEMRESGLSLAKIADALNAEGHRTRRGKLFTAVQVRNILLRG